MNGTKIKLELDVDDVNLILEALGQLPFVRVYSLIGRVQEQARAQIAATNGAGGNGAGALDERPGAGV